ncbi:MAG: thioesterase family protein [Candidatus Binatia bacterium]|nr:thioesterase family protein [Candidatus Binatia bacterium]
MIDFEAELREAFDPTAGTLTVSDVWEGFPATAFGGFVAAASLVAVSGAAEHPRPLSFSTRFHRPVPAGRAVKVEIEPERLGRLVDALTAPVQSDGKLLAAEGTSQAALVPMLT